MLRACIHSGNNTRARNEPNILRRNQKNVIRVQLQIQRVKQVFVRFQLQKLLLNMNVQSCDKLQIVRDKPSSLGISTADHDVRGVFIFLTINKWHNDT